MIDRAPKWARILVAAALGILAFYVLITATGMFASTQLQEEVLELRAEVDRLNEIVGNQASALDSISGAVDEAAKAIDEGRVARIERMEKIEEVLRIVQDLDERLG